MKIVLSFYSINYKNIHLGMKNSVFNILRFSKILVAPKNKSLYFFLALMLVSVVSWGQIAILELGTTFQSGNTTGVATFTSKDANINALPALSLTTAQQGQAGGVGYVASKTWNNASLNTATYWQFTVTATSGYQIAVTSLSLRMYRSATGPGSIALATDADSYATQIGGVQTLPSATNTTITFTGLSLSGKSSITFRVYAYGASAAAGTLRIGDGTASSSDISLVGSVTSSTSNDASLSALTTTAGALTPSFATATYAYSAAVSNATTSVTVTPTRNESHATIQARVNGGTYSSVTSGSASSALALNVGTNPIDVKVTAQDGTTIKTYTITVTRPSNDTTLSAMSISSGNLSPSFSSGTTSYTDRKSVV